MFSLPFYFLFLFFFLYLSQHVLLVLATTAIITFLLMLLKYFFFRTESVLPTELYLFNVYDCLQIRHLEMIIVSFQTQYNGAMKCPFLTVNTVLQFI